MHLNLNPFKSYGWNLVVSNIWSWCFLKQLKETFGFKIWEIFNLHPLFQVCLFDKSWNYFVVVVVKTNDSTFGLVGNQHLASLCECMETFNIETNFAISLTYNGIYNVWEPFIKPFNEKVKFVFLSFEKKWHIRFLSIGLMSTFEPPHPPQKLVLVFNNVFFLLGNFQKPTFMISGYLLVLH